MQYWNGSAWTTVSGGTITNNNLVWKKITFSAVTTSKIRITVNAAIDGVARLTEVEAWGTPASGLGPINYVLSDVQGSARARMNNSGLGASSIITRHDYLPFGEEISSGTGLRTTVQGYGGADTNRQKYGMTERDDSNGLDHTWWRKYESASGRWTSPDPYQGSMSIANPQSLNLYAYTHNDPVNFVDPSGLFSNCGGPYLPACQTEPPAFDIWTLYLGSSGWTISGEPGGGRGNSNDLESTEKEQNPTILAILKP